MAITPILPFWGGALQSRMTPQLWIALNQNILKRYKRERARIPQGWPARSNAPGISAKADGELPGICVHKDERAYYGAEAEGSLPNSPGYKWVRANGMAYALKSAYFSETMTKRGGTMLRSSNRAHKPFLFIRERYHPLFHLRRFPAYQWLTRRMDISVAIRFASVDHPVYVSLSKNLSWVLSGGSAGEESERDHFITLLRLSKFRRFFDVGANVGLYGFLFRSLAEDGSLAMIEPDADNAKLIRRTIARASLDRVRFLQAAASDKPGTCTFYKDELSGATGSLRRSGRLSFVSVYHRHAPKPVPVECVTLDSLCAHDEGDPDFIKIDVEGAELRVLHGAENILDRSHPVLFFECDEDQPAVHSFLSQHGYVFFDFCTMHAVDTIPHNCLALHPPTHPAILNSIGEGRFSGTVPPH